MTETDNGADGEISNTLTGVSPQGQASSPEEDDGGQEDGGGEDVGATVVAGCNGPPVLLSGKERLDCVTPAIQPLVVMDWLLAAATGRDARHATLPGQHLADFVLVIPLIPKHRGSRRQILQHPISASEVTALPFPPVQPQRTTFAVPDPMELAGHAPLGATDPARGNPPLLRLDAVGWTLTSVASIISTSGSGASHGSTGSGGSMASDGSEGSDADNSEKISSKTPLSHQRRQRLSRVLWEPSAAGTFTRDIHPGHPPGAAPSEGQG